MNQDLFKTHLATTIEWTTQALSVAKGEGVDAAGALFHSGGLKHYHHDDHPVAFRAVAHFLRFAPLSSPDHVVRFVGGEAHLFEFVPHDFWEEAPARADHPFRQHLPITTVSSREELRSALGDVSKCAYIGDDPEFANSLDVPASLVEPPALIQALDWFRAYKTEYEVDRISEAIRRSGVAHEEVLDGFRGRQSERTLVDRYLNATGHRESNVAFDAIVAWDEHASILHYQAKKQEAPNPGSVLLFDCGARVDGYCSDTTRTYLHDDVHPSFREIVARLDTLVHTLIDSIRPGTCFVDLQRNADRGIAEILCAVDVLRCTTDEAFDRGLTAPFFPHGLGHHLGIQTHDRGGFLPGPTGDPVAAPDRYPFLRTTRPLESNQVVTIEPGIYFIPMLLEPFRSGGDASSFNWSLIETLTPHGGVRIEDDVLVTADGCKNLSSEVVPR